MERASQVNWGITSSSLLLSLAGLMASRHQAVGTRGSKSLRSVLAALSVVASGFEVEH